MKLRNKKTGEIRNAVDIDMYTDSVYLKVSDGESDNETIEYHSLAELNEEWEDYEEPKGIQCIYYVNHFDATRMNGVLIGFDTEEEANKAVEKLKAWKRLKDKGFRFVKGWLDDNDDFIIKAKLGYVGLIDQPDVQLLFGGEEMSNIKDLPAFPPASLTKDNAEELLAEIEKAKNHLTTYLKNIGGSEE